MRQESNAISSECLVLRQDTQQTFVSLNAQQQMIRSELDQLNQQNRMRKRGEIDTQMADVRPQPRRNLTRREYRTEIPRSSQTTSIHPLSGNTCHMRNRERTKTGIFAPGTPTPTQHGNSSSILPDAPTFAGNSQDRTASSWRLRKLPPPQKFEIEHMEGWLREVRLRRALYRHIDDDHILACLCLNCSGEIKDIVMGPLEENRAAPAFRNF